MQLHKSQGQTRIITANIRGLYPKKFKQKVNILADYASYHDVGFIILTESHLQPKILDAEIAIKNYQLYRCDRANHRKGGGVIVYVRRDFNKSCRTIRAESNTVVECLTLHIKSLDLFIGAIYRPPKCEEVAKFTQMLNNINEDIERLGTPAPNILILGDLNMPKANWTTLEIYGGSDSIRRQAQSLFSFTETHALEQLVQGATRGQNTLDLCFSNNDELIDHIEINDSILSDHRLLFLTTNIFSKQNNPSESNERKPPMRQLNFYHESINWEVINEKFLNIDWDSVFQDLNPDTMHEILLTKIIKISKETIPLRKGGAKRNRVIPRDRRLLMKKRTKVTKQLSRATARATKDRLGRRLTELEQGLAASHREECQRNEERAIATIKLNPKYFYSYARNRAKIKGEIGPLNTNGKLVCDPYEKSEILRCQYESVFSRPCPDDGDDDGLPQDPRLTESVQDIDFNPEDFIGSIADLPSSSAPGPDGIPTLLLKKCTQGLKRPLYLLWRASLDSGRVPYELKKGLITPIFKGGERSTPKNYRPVVLTSQLSKVFEKIVVKNIVDHLERQNLYNETQHGFRRGRSCLSQLLEHYHMIVAALAEGSCVDVIYLDFAKAFDKVDHKVLLRKLRRIGIEGKLLKWIQSFLTGRKQAVVVDGAKSIDSEVISGVPQGSVLGPLLFLIHMYDIDAEVAHASLSSFADDTRVLKEVRNSEDGDHLQQDLNKIYQWAENNNMQFNGAKFEMMQYSNNNLTIHTSYQASDGSVIPRKEQVRDLGIEMQDTATFELQIWSMVARAKRQMGWVLRTFATRDQFAMLTLYKAMILPLLEYSSQLWNPATPGLIRALEGVQRTFTVRIRGMDGLNYWQRLRKLELYSLERRRERYLIIYMFKIIMGLVPNIKVNGLTITWYHHIRRGRLCKIPGLKRRADVRIQSIRERCFALRGPRLFNSLPQDLREYSGTVESFKNKLDKFLQKVLDQPVLPHYYQTESDNSLISQRRLMNNGTADGGTGNPQSGGRRAENRLR